METFIIKKILKMEKNYVIKFYFNTINKQSKIKRESGEVDITTDMSASEMPKNEFLLKMIADEMSDVTGKVILSVEITKIIPNPNDNGL